jgi:hypothetical protein
VGQGDDAQDQDTQAADFTAWSTALWDVLSRDSSSASSIPAHAPSRCAGVEEEEAACSVELYSTKAAALAALAPSAVRSSCMLDATATYLVPVKANRQLLQAGNSY